MAPTVGPVNDDDVAGYTAAAAAPASLEGAPPSYFPPASTSSLPSYHHQQQQLGYLAPYPASSSPSYHHHHQQQRGYFPPYPASSSPSYHHLQQRQQQWSYFPPDLPSPPSYHQLQQQQQYEYYPCPPEPEAAGRFNGFPDFGSKGNVGFDGLLAMQRNLLTSAMPPPPAQMQTASMEMQWHNPLQSAVIAMQGGQRSFESPWQATAAAAVAPVHAAPFAPDDRAVVPVDAPPAAPDDRVVVPVDAVPFAPDDRAIVPADAPPAALAAKRPRGRPRGSTAASKSELAGTSRQKKTGPRRRAANPLPPPTPTPIQEPPTSSEHPTTAAADTSAIVVSQHNHGDQPEHCGGDKKKTAEEALATIVDAEEDTEYADTSPPGVRFRPSDAEAIAFLQLKYLNRKMPVNFFKEFNVYKQHPDTIQETYGESVDGAWYVFWSRKRKYGFGRRPSRSVEVGEKVGFWKPNTKETEILVDGVAVGTVNALTFELGKQTGKSSHTAWKMKEYRIPDFQKERDGVMMLLDPWVMYKIYKAKDKPKGVAAVEKGDGGPTNVDESVNGTDGGGEEENTVGTYDGGEDGTTVGTEGGREDGTTAGESVKERPDGVTDEEQDLCVDDYFMSGDDDLFFLMGDDVTHEGISSDNLLQ